ncbi:cryptochrome/photolyase family protein [Acidithiobacillus sp.]|uniref:cryptochrome/photolyase family protein n=1 Tax=Acidithiobacillus sp. TaxID=1872118 RepID=UPI0025BB62A1|nr:cryptochrome/photolyase family protein [Acidithiobacillus sp.]
MPKPLRRLVLLLGDHLDLHSPHLATVDPERDLCLLVEARSESQGVWSHKARIALFLAAMRHAAEALRQRGLRVEYWALGQHPYDDLVGAVAAALQRFAPQRLALHEPGTWALAQGLRETAAAAGVAYELWPATPFLFPLREFESWAKGHRQHRMEFWYRHARRLTGILMDGEEPQGGRWNFDSDNRGSFGKAGPGALPEPLAFAPDATTGEVLATVEREFPGHPGSLKHFDWPVTMAEAEAALGDFITHRLPSFGRFQDASWPGAVWLYHSRLSAAMNLGLLHPQKVIQAVLDAHAQGHASLAATEGFVRQILGWREFVRGIYWRYMPDYLQENALGATLPLPHFYWTAETEMACLRDVLQRTLDYGYAHHIERLMVTGLFALLLGVAPQAIHAWYLAIYVDAVEWVELPNVLGMSQYADGGRVASKPYVASGRYLARMTGHCNRCPYRPQERVGSTACPFTTLYWDFLIRHAETFARHPRTALQWKHLESLDAPTRSAIGERAEQLRTAWAKGV